MKASAAEDDPRPEPHHDRPPDHDRHPEHHDRPPDHHGHPEHAGPHEDPPPGAYPAGRSTRAHRAAVRKLERERRHALAQRVAQDHAGVARVGDLLGTGLTRDQIRAEIEAGVWRKVGRRTVFVAGGEPAQQALWWWALWESGERSVLDGVTSLLAAGLTGWSAEVIHISLPNNAHPRPLPGVRHHRLRDVGLVQSSGLRRTKAVPAALRAAQWAASDRQAATLIAMAVQQGIVSGAELLDHWHNVTTSPRRKLLELVIRDVCDGAQSLNELDFAHACRERGLPEPTRQAIRRGRHGLVFLDVLWDELGVHAEIHGAQHYSKLASIEDSLRANEVQILGQASITLQIPVLGWRLRREEYLDQVAQALMVAKMRLAS